MGRHKKFGDEATISTAIRLPESFYEKKPEGMSNSDWILLQMNVDQFKDVQTEIIEKISDSPVITKEGISNKQKNAIKYFVDLFGEFADNGILDNILSDEDKATKIFDNLDILEGM